MKILVTGSDGFVAKNLILQLGNFKNLDILKLNKKNYSTLNSKIKEANFIVHLAGTNRSKNKTEFINNNHILTKEIVKILKKNNLKTPILYSSTIRYLDNNIYGKTKLKAENVLKKFSKENNSYIGIFRFPNIFGKWSKPHYNSVISTFCYNILNNKKINLYNNKEKIKLIYIDDVINLLIKNIFKKKSKKNYEIVKIINYKNILLSKIKDKLFEFNNSNQSIYTPNLNNDFEKNLYSTFISYANKKQISSKIKINENENGNFIELFKNKNFGQISVFTTPPNKVRGMHYHNTKVEKFFIVQGKAEISYFNSINNKKYIFKSKNLENKIITTLPGWIHTIKNVGKNNLIIIVWSNEIFNIKKPDTYVRI